MDLWQLGTVNVGRQEDERLRQSVNTNVRFQHPAATSPATAIQQFWVLKEFIIIAATSSQSQEDRKKVDIIYQGGRGG